MYVFLCSLIPFVRITEHRHAFFSLITEQKRAAYFNSGSRFQDYKFSVFKSGCSYTSSFAHHG